MSNSSTPSVLYCKKGQYHLTIVCLNLPELSGSEEAVLGDALTNIAGCIIDEKPDQLNNLKRHFVCNVIPDGKYELKEISPDYSEFLINGGTVGIIKQLLLAEDPFEKYLFESKMAKIIQRKESPNTSQAVKTQTEFNKRLKNMLDKEIDLNTYHLFLQSFGDFSEYYKLSKEPGTILISLDDKNPDVIADKDKEPLKTHTIGIKNKGVLITDKCNKGTLYIKNCNTFSEVFNKFKILKSLDLIGESSIESLDSFTFHNDIKLKLVNINIGRFSSWVISEDIKITPEGEFDYDSEEPDADKHVSGTTDNIIQPRYISTAALVEQEENKKTIALIYKAMFKVDEKLRQENDNASALLDGIEIHYFNPEEAKNYFKATLLFNSLKELGVLK